MGLPWDYSEAPEPDEETYLKTERDPMASKLGAMLAQACDRQEEIDRVRFPNHLPRCHDCALRKGTLPNGDPETLMDLVKCVVENNPFYCHAGLKEGEKPKRLCTGFVQLSSPEASAALRRALAPMMTSATPGDDE